MNYIIAAFFVIFAVCFDNISGRSPCKCEEPLTFLDEIGCKATYEGDSCCPTKYDCSHLHTLPDNKCRLQNALYDNGQKIPDDIIAPFCKVACSCRKDSSPDTDFTCAILDCPEWLGFEPNVGCEWKYDVNFCCSVGQICPPVDNLAKCNVDGKVYYEGQEFYSKLHQSLKCVCQTGFEGKFEEPFCIKTKCLSEIDKSKSIQKFCAPVYFIIRKDEEPVCPLEFICPSNDKIIPSGRSHKDKCKYGSQELNLGDKFQRVAQIHDHEKHETKCECKIPPFVTCIKTIVYDKDKKQQNT